MSNATSKKGYNLEGDNFFYRKDSTLTMKDIWAFILKVSLDGLPVSESWRGSTQRSLAEPVPQILEPPTSATPKGPSLKIPMLWRRTRLVGQCSLSFSSLKYRKQYRVHCTGGAS